MIGVTGVALAHNLRTLADLLMLAWRAQLFAETTRVILWPLMLLAGCIVIPALAYGWPWISLGLQAALIAGAAALRSEERVAGKRVVGTGELRGCACIKKK